MRFSISVAGHSTAVDISDARFFGYFKRELQPFRYGGVDSQDGFVLTIALDYTRRPLPATADGITVNLPQGPDLLLNVEAGLKNRVDLSVEIFNGDRQLSHSLDLIYSFLVNYVISLYLQKLQAEGLADICLAHGSGVALLSRGYLFTGPSGSGKTTVARGLMQVPGARQLGDDLVILTCEERGWMLHGSPMAGELPRDCIANISVPLEAVYFISQAAETRRRRMRPVVATAALLASLAPSYPIEKSGAPHLSALGPLPLWALMDGAAGLAGEVPCFELALSPGEQSWDEIIGITGK